MFIRLTMSLGVLVVVCGCGKSSPTSPTASAGPRTLYVSTTGSNASDGSATAPWLTLRHALTQLRAGDTLYMRGGTYTGRDNTVDSELGAVTSGTSASNTTTIAGAPGETVTIQPPNGQHGIRLTSGAPHYLIFQDFTIDMANQTTSDPNGIYLSSGAHHNRFQRLEVKNSYGNAIVFSPNNGNSPFNEVLNCSLHDNGRGPGINSGYGAYIETSDNLFAGNDVYNNGGYGLHFYNNEGPLDVARNVIRNNNIHGNGTHGGSNYGIVVAWGDGNLIEGNTISGNRGGVLVYVRSSNTKVSGNTIHNNRPLEGILIDSATGTQLRDNVVYDNEVDILDLGVGTTFSGNRGNP